MRSFANICCLPMPSLDVIQNQQSTTLVRHQYTAASPELQSLARKFYEETSPEEIGNARIRFFELLHSSSDSLFVIRKSKYEQMLLSNRANTDPLTLPPSPRTAYFHGLRVYHQIKVWRDLRDSDSMPLNWGRQLVGDSMTPIMTDEEAGLPTL